MMIKKIFKWLKYFFTGKKEVPLPDRNKLRFLKQYSDDEERLIVAVNLYRISKGFNPVLVEDFMSRVTMDHVLYMIGQGEPSHDNYGHRYTVLKNVLNISTTGEIVAYGYNKADGALKGWINSDGHRKTMEGDFNFAGVAVGTDIEGKKYFCVTFCKII